MNPYQPPNTETKFAPLSSRFRRGVKMAVAEYRRGLRRENISTLHHMRLWFTVLFVGFWGSVMLRGLFEVFLEILPTFNSYKIG